MKILPPDEPPDDAFIDADADTVINAVDDLEHMWKLVPTKDVPNPAALDVAQNLGLEQLLNDTNPDINAKSSTFIMELARRERKKQSTVLTHILHRAQTLGITLTVRKRDSDDRGPNLPLHHKINRLYARIEQGFLNVKHCVQTSDQFECPGVIYGGECEIDPEYFHVSTHIFCHASRFVHDELNPYQRSLFACLQEAYVRKLRRYKGTCCRERVVDGHRTRAWEPVYEIKQFVHEMANKEYRHNLWKDLTSKGSGFRDVINHLENCTDHQFPEIQKSRHMWSFRDGLFLGKELDELTGSYVCKFLPYDSDEFKQLKTGKVSCKYFDVEFPDYTACEDWWNIPTPNFSQILDFQRLPEDVQRWAFVLGGRLCYEVGELDGWQVLPFFKGIARSGKSTVINDVCKQFYDTGDVKTLSNNIEKKFGLSSVCDGLMFIAPEIKSSMALEQAEFQSIVSGESVSLAVKHEKAKSEMVWTTPGVMAGNEVPGWKDTGGSVIRRLVTFNFTRQVKDADSKLPEKLHAEIPLILQKCIRAYLDYSQHEHRDVGNIWDVLPSYFLDVRKEIEEAVSPLDKYLNSSEVVLDPNHRCPSSAFQDAFMEFATRRCGEKGIKFTIDFTRGPFSARGITREHRTEQWEGDMYDEEFFVGVTLKQSSTF